MRKLVPFSLSLLALSLIHTAQADDNTLALPSTSINTTASVDSDDGSGPGYKAKPASSTTRLNLTEHETPQGISSIKREQMDDFQLNSIRDVLDNTPGVNVQKVETDRTYFTARGFDITNFQYDGTGMPFTGGLLVGDVDTVLYDQVDVLHGANGLMTGLGNPSATVNFVRKRPTYTPQASVTLGAGSWDKRRVDLDVSGPLTDSGNVRGRFIYSNETGNSYLDRYSREKNTLAGLLAFDLTDSDTLTLGYESQKTASNGSSWGALPLTDASGNRLHYSSSANISQPWVYWDVETQRVFGEWEHSFANDWKSRLTITGVQHDEDTEMFYILASSTSSTGYSGLNSKYKDKMHEIDGDLSLSGPFTFGGREHQLTVGANWARAHNKEMSLYNEASYYANVSLEDALAGNIPRTTDWNKSGEDTGSNYNDYQKSLYAGARFSLADDLHLITGARMLSADSSGDSYGATRSAHTHGKVTPYAGIVYDLTPEYALYASYTEIFNPQYQHDTTGAILDPLEGKAYEAGIKGQLLDKRLNVSAAVFHTKQDNVATYAGYDASLGGYLYNGLSLESQGVELEASGELAQGLQVTGGYTYVDVTDEDDDRAQRFIPQHALTSSVTYRLPMAEQVKLGANVRWQSKVEYDSNTTARQDAYALFGLMAHYDIDDHWSTQLNLNNLTNEKYFLSPRYGQSNYGDPRNFMATVSWKM